MVTFSIGGQPVNFPVDMGASHSALTKPLGPLDKRTVEAQGVTGETKNYNWTTKQALVFIFTQGDQQISAIKGPRNPSECCCVLIGKTDCISRKSFQLQEQGCLFQNGAPEPPSHHNTLHSTGRDSDKAGTVCPQDFRTKHFYFLQKASCRGLQSSCFP